MDKFQQADIPVVAVDIPMVGATFFGVDNYRAGHMAGKALGEWVEGRWQSQIDHPVGGVIYLYPVVVLALRVLISRAEVAK